MGFDVGERLRVGSEVGMQVGFAEGGFVGLIVGNLEGALVGFVVG